MAEHEDRVIVAALEDRADRGAPRGAEAVVADAWRRHDRTAVVDPRFHQRRARGVWMATAAAVVIVVILLARGMPEPAPDGNVPGTTTTTTTLSWQQVGTLPTPVRDVNESAPTVWTGTEVVLVGGLTHHQPGEAERMAESAAFDPATGRTRLIAEPPVGLGEKLLGAVWTGREIIVVAPEWHPTADRSFGPWPAVAYDPAQDTWRTLASAPPLIGMVWTGDRVIGWTRTVMVAYEPATDRWTEHGPSFAALDPASDIHYWGPVAWGREQLASFGQEIAVFTPGPDTMVKGAAFAPPFGSSFAAVSGDTLLIYGQEPNRQQRVAIWDLGTSTGRVSTAGPADSVAVPPAIAVVNGRLVTWNDQQDGSRRHAGGGTLYDPATDRWSSVPYTPFRNQTLSGVGVGDRLIVWAKHWSDGPSLSVFSMTVN